MVNHLLNIPIDQVKWLSKNYTINNWYSNEFINVNEVFDSLCGNSFLRLNDYRGEKDDFVTNVYHSLIYSIEDRMKMKYIIQSLHILDDKLKDTEFYEIMHNLKVIMEHIEMAENFYYFTVGYSIEKESLSS